MKVLIVEDERSAAQKLIRLLKEVDPHIQVIAVLASVEETTVWFHRNPNPDLILFNLKMG